MGDARKKDGGNGSRRNRRLWPDYSRSLLVGLDLLPLFSRETPLLGVADLALRAGVSRPTAHRYASTYVRLGYLQQDNSRKYFLAPKAAGFGWSVITWVRDALSVQGVLEGLREKTGYTVSLGILRGAGVTYVYRLAGHRRGQYQADMELRAGARIPLYCSALGKALFATLSEEERRQAVPWLDLVPHGPRSVLTHEELLAELASIDVLAPVLSDEELVAGSRSIAMYVPRPKPERAIGVEVTVPSANLTTTELRKQIGPHVGHAAELIARIGGEKP